MGIGVLHFFVCCLKFGHQNKPFCVFFLVSGSVQVFLPPHLKDQAQRKSWTCLAGSFMSQNQNPESMFFWWLRCCSQSSVQVTTCHIQMSDPDSRKWGRRAPWIQCSFAAGPTPAWCSLWRRAAPILSSPTHGGWAGPQSGASSRSPERQTGCICKKSASFLLITGF